MWPLITHYHHCPWNYYSHPNIIVVLNWEWSAFRKFACGLQNGTRAKKQENISSVKKKKKKFLRSDESAPRLLFLSSSVNECRGDVFVWGREQRGSLISTPFYLCPTAPASQPPCAFTCRGPTGSCAPWRAKVREGEKATHPFIH